jgi:hypothetical protein
MFPTSFKAEVQFSRKGFILTAIAILSSSSLNCGKKLG